MAELLIAGGGTGASEVALTLRDALEEEYLVVAQPAVRGGHAEAIVLGAQGIYVLYAQDWSGEVRPSARGPWRVRLPSGQVQSYPNPRQVASDFDKGLRAFLRDEFPRLRAPIHHLVVLTAPDAQVGMYGAMEPPVVPLDNVATEIASLGAGSPPVLDGELLRELGVALCERQLSRRQRATHPFICQRSGIWGAARLWTVDSLIRHLDRHPQDGVHHLRNGSLERWLRDQGALHLADLAQRVGRDISRDARVALEEFLLGSGLVGRPRIRFRPRKLDLRYTLYSRKAIALLRVRKGSGRGYLHGRIEPAVSYVTVEPDDFSGSADVLVNVDPVGLEITGRPYHTSLSVHSNATEEPVLLPVTFQPVPEPPFVVRYLVRPVGGALLGALLGILCGVAFGRWGLGLPDVLGLGQANGSGAGALWALLLGTLGAGIGLLRGALQNVAWPLLYATRRWLARILFWAVILPVIALALLAIAPSLYSPVEGVLTDEVRATVLLVSAFAGLIPATVGELQTERVIEEGEKPAERKRSLRRLTWAVGILLVLLILVLGSRTYGGDLSERYQLGSRFSGLQGTMVGLWQRGEQALQGIVDKMYIRYYDRRAPVRPTVSPTGGATAVPTTERATPAGGQ